ncbi:hypothetical protein FDP41_013050 [Naegleria fowleri]|uniref:Guanine nucleotide-binding protein subunit beta-like protein n=1 Tax=Naegleria fowleri TaxID=5763 RepID=A0A6A5C3D6_NAEFO|nr:uncharacterized protein FDP41_013050 [Naegleria fowleri]KAF0981262.1 hypothetical protein FDP41_013050 [Naegleria fowleri]
MIHSDCHNKLHLVDFIVSTNSSSTFNETNHHQTMMNFDLFEKLKQTMRNGKKRILKPFKMKFELVHTLGKVCESGSDPDLFSHPFDVKISYNFESILISDSNNSRIQVFDMHTKQFKKSINTASKNPMYLCIEENCDGSNNDALIFGCCSDSTVNKFDLGKELAFVQQDKSCSPPYLWISTAVLSNQGITCSNKSGHVFVCDVGDCSVKILASSSGELTQTIKLSLQPYGIEFANFYGDDYLIISESSTLKDGKDQCQIFRLKSTTSSFEYDLVTTFGRGGNELGDYRNHRIQIFSKEGTFVACLTDFGRDRICYPNGLCLNGVLGELISCDWANHVVQFFN